MSDEDDQSDNERVGSSEYLVGYKKPPPQHRFQKGRSGNPRGRPRQRGKRADASVLDAQALMLHEAYRLVSIREGDRIVKMPAIQAVMRGLGVAAIKGNPRAQLAFKEIRIDRSKAACGQTGVVRGRFRIQARVANRV
jgi:Family of unknown function (DUF5681)